MIGTGRLQSPMTRGKSAKDMNIRRGGDTWLPMYKVFETDMNNSTHICMPARRMIFHCRFRKHAVSQS
jgi:hypothetical protein